MTRRGAQLVVLIAIVGTIGCDRATKHLAASTLADGVVRSFLSGVVRLELVENRGGFLSLGSQLDPGVRMTIFTVGVGALLLALIGLAVRWRWRGWSLVGLALFVAGGASNWIDRLLHGAVVDFIVVGVGPLRTGIFNVADVAIMAGAVLVVATMEWSSTKTST
jgi:signal peptidase II